MWFEWALTNMKKTIAALSITLGVLGNNNLAHANIDASGSLPDMQTFTEEYGYAAVELAPETEAEARLAMENEVDGWNGEVETVDVESLFAAMSAGPNGRAAARSCTQTGGASWYGPGFQGKKTANGERFNTHDMTAANKSLPFGTRVRVTNLSNGRSVVVRINDRGPYAHGRIIDLSHAAAQAIGISGVGRVQLSCL